ncbi:MAG: hypothetical protein WCJ07_04710 [Verrucomicrobiota bacterium]
MTLLALTFLTTTPAKSGTNTIQLGVNIHDGGGDPKVLADKLAERNLKLVRMDLWGNDPRYLA